MFGWSLLLKVLNCSCTCAQRVLVCPYLPGTGDADYGALTVFLVWQWQAPFGKSLYNLWGYCHGVMLWPQILLSPCYKDVKQDCPPLSLFSRFEVIIHFLSVGWEENDDKRIWYILAPTFLFLKAQDICGRNLWNPWWKVPTSLHVKTLCVPQHLPVICILGNQQGIFF